MNTFCLVMVGLVVSVGVGAQRPTLRDDVKRESGPIEKQVRSLPEPQSVKSLLAVSDLVVRVIVGPPLTSYLTVDGTDVRTDYRLQVTEVLPSLKPPTVPFQADANGHLTLTQRGGTVVIDGHSATVRHKALAPLTPGTQALMFLVRVGDKYEIAMDYYGVFAVHGETVVPVTPHVFDEHHQRGLSLGEFRDEVANTR